MLGVLGNLVRHRLIAVCLAGVVGVSGSVAVQAMTAPPAQAATLSCAWPRCTLYLNRTETYNFAYGGGLPSVPRGLVGALWTVTKAAHRLIARSYYSSGYCIAFRLSAVPWETQGMFAYRC